MLRFRHYFFLLMAACILCPAPAHAQERLEISADWKCSFDGQQGRGTVYTFSSDRQAQDAVDRIVQFTGLRSNFVVKAADVENAEAFIQDRQRYILYSQAFMMRIAARAQTDWAATGVIAHEIGHHLQGHTIQAGGSRPEVELEADRFAGFILQKMGATLDQALAGWKEFSNDQETLTHPGKQTRLAAVTNGWVAARDLNPDPTPPPVGKELNEIWFVTMSKGLNYTQKYKIVETLPSDALTEDWNAGYDITRIAEGDGRWVVVMSNGTSYQGQVYRVSATFPGEWIKEKWDEGFRITSLAGGHGQWVVVMSKGSGITMQSYRFEENLPAAYIKEYWDKEYRITALAVQNNQYAVVMSQGAGLTQQTYNPGQEIIPVDWIKEKWDEGYHITAVARKGQHWTVVMSKGAGYSSQFFWLTEDFPRDWIKQKWAEDYDISILY